MTEPNNERRYYEHLVDIMLTTRGIRFSVAEREKRKEKFSIGVIAVLSIYLAGWSLAASLFPDALTETQARALSFISVVASVSLLVISLFDFAASRSVYAEKMLQNAFSIAEILREAERELAKGDPDYARLSILASTYEAKVSGVGVNHTSKDYKLWKLQRRSPSGWLEASQVWVTSKILSCLAFTSAMFFQIAIVVLIVASTCCILAVNLVGSG
ncbi:SLATT domain-containing protein [Rhodovulum sulfidophilum]|uniref:SLATT domain-containing protein n=1 Tax=Rhodovulum sulfidophilum TaxID=35806 RepID=UPI0019220F63|nr:SLATT domain-containing protein [Rhodovulum sulfidophilum]MBL3598050.1 SLATT domain-containing protein [Rhodovulum sulfidophilum]